MPLPRKRAPRSFNKGLAIRSRTEMVYRLPAGFKRLHRNRRHRPGRQSYAAMCGCPYSPTTARCSKRKSLAIKHSQSMSKLPAQNG